MTQKFALKAVCAALALAATGGAYAAPIYLNNGVDYSGVVSVANISTEVGQMCATCTSLKNEILITYDSKSTITDTNGSASLNAGDSVLTNGGLSTGFGLGTNRVTGFNPGETNVNSDNGYGGSRWQLSFSITALPGVVTGVTAGVPSITYGPGLLEMFVTTDGGTTFSNFMDIKLYGGGATGLGTLLFGEADFTNVTASAFNNMFHSGAYSCGGSSGFFDIWTNCGGAADLLNISFVSSFDTNVTASSVIDNGDGTWSITSNHDGSAVFAVPEPGSLALLGLALAGLGLTQRRRKLEK